MIFKEQPQVDSAETSQGNSLTLNPLDFTLNKTVSLLFLILMNKISHPNSGIIPVFNIKLCFDHSYLNRNYHPKSNHLEVRHFDQFYKTNSEYTFSICAKS